jgi:hypothetical protein
MPKAATRAKARTIPKTNHNAAIIERVNRRYNQPGLHEKGLEVLTKNAPTEPEVNSAQLGAALVAAARAAGNSDAIIDAIEAHSLAWGLFMDIDNMEPRDEKLRRRADQVEEKARRRLLTTPPTTLAGMRAIIEYLIKWDEHSEPETSYEYLSTLLLSPIFAKEQVRT